MKIVPSQWNLLTVQPLQHGMPCETHLQKRAKTTPQEVEAQPAVDEMEESSPNGSDSEASSSSQSTSTFSFGPGARAVLSYRTRRDSSGNHPTL